jgi:membrane-associated phospholipid phosphatase
MGYLLRISFLIFALFILSVSNAENIKKQEKSFEFNKNILIVGVPLTVLSFSLDDEIKSFSQENKNDFLNSITDFFDFFGSEYAVIVPTSTFFYGTYKSDDKLAKASRVAVLSTITSVLVVYPIKLLTNRKRPDNSDDLSFPSGHTAISFAIFGSYAHYYNEGITPYVLYTVPVLTAYSRIYKNKHHFSDVVAGAVIGLSSVYFGKWLDGKINFRFSISGSFQISRKEGILYVGYKF